MNQQPGNAALQQDKSTRVKWAIACLIGPILIFIITIIAYAALNFIIGVASPESDGQSGPVQVVLNIILFLVGGLAATALFPGIIAGIILLATQKK